MPSVLINRMGRRGGTIAAIPSRRHGKGTSNIQTGGNNTQAMDGPTLSQDDQRHLLQGWQASSHQQPWTQTAAHPIPSWPAGVWTPRDQPNYMTTGKVLLVARTSKGDCGLRLRVCRMPTPQGQYLTSSSSTKPNLPDTWSTSLRDNCTGFYH